MTTLQTLFTALHAAWLGATHRRDMNEEMDALATALGFHPHTMELTEPTPGADLGDSARLDWLIRQGPPMATVEDGVYDEVFKMELSQSVWDAASGEKPDLVGIREAIDAAMQAAQPAGRAG